MNYNQVIASTTDYNAIGEVLGSHATTYTYPGWDLFIYALIIIIPVMLIIAFRKK